MIFAIIDLGTNTFNLLIAERLQNSTFRKIFNTRISVKLGEGTINDGYIAPAPFQRGIDALKQFQHYLMEFEVEHTYAFATSAIRSASNGPDFVALAKKETGITVTTIDGNEEADLIYHGNRMAVNMNESISLIMDIGGGSTEFILANHTTVFWKQSFLLGAARLMERFSLSDPITREETALFNDYLRQELVPLFEAVKKFKSVELIGSSGAFDSVIDVIAGEFNTGQLNENQTEYAINLEHYFFISEKIKRTNLKDRYHIKGLIDMRVDMIVISVLLIDFILNEFELNAMRVSTFSLKEGVISQKLGLSLS
ncbi:MAG: exopolyphosphatase [Bacteroidetes bacterium]|jgi:exopolyphosphatase/guanosine-5'-triphosphate,3'-diphosphate pyrophosphatase|nr:exopolyphosphatase [Bacteroidota bacterium]MDF2451361.1 exopolyphosphatase [Bacteroidota bacterium]